MCEWLYISLKFKSRTNFAFFNYYGKHSENKFKAIELLFGRR